MEALGRAPPLRGNNNRRRKSTTLAAASVLFLGALVCFRAGFAGEDDGLTATQSYIHGGRRAGDDDWEARRSLAVAEWNANWNDEGGEESGNAADVASVQTIHPRRHRSLASHDNRNFPIVKAAQSVYRNSTLPFIVVMQASVGIVPLLKSWLCNTASMEGVHSSTLLIIDGAGYGPLKEFASIHAPDVTIVRDALPEYLQGSWPYGTRGYWRTTQNRVDTVGDVIELGRVPILLAEPDATWLQNVYDDPDLAGEEATATDVIGIGDEDVMCFCFLRVNPTDDVIRVWDYTRRRVEAELGGPIDPKEDPHEMIDGIKGEQRYFTQMARQVAKDRKAKARQQQGGGEFLRMLPSGRYPDGLWYDGDIRPNGTPKDGGKSFRAECRESEPRGVAVVQQNWIVGNECKRMRSKRWDHWFLDDKADRCVAGDPRAALEMARRSARVGSPPHGPPSKLEHSGKCPSDWELPGMNNTAVI